MQIFTVYSLGCNAELFAANYGEYIKTPTQATSTALNLHSAHRPRSAPK